MKEKLYNFTLVLIFFTVAVCFIYFFHSRYLSVDVVLYSALQDVLLASSITSLIIFNTNRFSIFNQFEKVQMTCFCAAFGFGLAIAGPTVIDRSLSFYILEKINQAGGAIKNDYLEDIFKTEYMREHRLVDIRLTEQLESGTVRLDDGCIYLTDVGYFISSASMLFRQKILPRKRLIGGVYTNELTDLYNDHESIIKYKCE